MRKLAAFAIALSMVAVAWRRSAPVPPAPAPAIQALLRRARTSARRQDHLVARDVRHQRRGLNKIATNFNNSQSAIKSKRSFRVYDDL